MAEVSGRPDGFQLEGALAATQQYAGEYRAAAATSQRALTSGARQGPGCAGWLPSDQRRRPRYGGFVCGNEATVQQALSLDKSKQTEATAVLAAAVCGNGKLALPWRWN